MPKARRPTTSSVLSELVEHDKKGISALSPLGIPYLFQTLINSPEPDSKYVSTTVHGRVGHRSILYVTLLLFVVKRHVRSEIGGRHSNVS